MPTTLAALVRHPATARFLSRKLFSFFVHDQPSASTLERLNFADRLTSGRAPDQPYFTDISSHISGHDLRTAADILNYYVGLLVDGDATVEARRALVDYLAADAAIEDGRLPDDKMRSTLHLVMSLPTFQLA